MDKMLISIALAFIFGALLATTFFIIGNNMNEQIAEYNYEQAGNMCTLANSYRNLSLMLEPSLSSRLPPALDCKRLLELTGT